MSTQLPLPGMNTVRRPTDGLFFALFPDQSATIMMGQLVERLRTEHGLVGAPVKPTDLHVTLHYLGRFDGLPGQIVTAARAAADTIRLASFQCAFDQVESFSGHAGATPIILSGAGDMAGLAALHRELGSALKGYGLRAESEPTFKPHVTLLYDERRVLTHTVEPIGRVTHEFALVHSVGHRYDQLARWRFDR